MTDPATTRMSSKGQVVIPEEIRKRLGLKPGIQFIVVGDRDVVILKAISPPSMEDFEELTAQARKQARSANMRKLDVSRAVKAVRRKR